MPVFLILLLLGTLGYMFWRRKTTSLTRECRWRKDGRAGQWRCAYCGAVDSGEGSPTQCRRNWPAP
ncbi:MAG: hypothetical protein BM562_08950 [Alphaproteobacteria bacterium MedPE-SWcel]|nr:MAG: hypothetical protein BM562_08950 [Alphaproteobacteria bacterium MedPE-SWcel]